MATSLYPRGSFGPEEDEEDPNAELAAVLGVPPREKRMTLTFEPAIDVTPRPSERGMEPAPAGPSFVPQSADALTPAPSFEMGADPLRIIEEGQRRSQELGLAAALAKGGAMIGAAIGGQKVDPAFDDLQRMAKEPLNTAAVKAQRLEHLMGQKRAFQAAQAARAAKDLEAKQKALERKEDTDFREKRAEALETHRREQERIGRILAGEKREEKAVGQTKEFAEDLDKLGAPGFYQKYSEAKDLIDKARGGLPGFGKFRGRLPDFLVSDEGVGLRQAIGQMLAEYRKGITGAGMSESEKVEFGEITGLMRTNTDEAIQMGVERLRRAMDGRVAARAAGTPEAASTYAERQPWAKEAIKRAAAPTGQASGAAGTSERFARHPRLGRVPLKEGVTIEDLQRQDKEWVLE